MKKKNETNITIKRPVSNRNVYNHYAKSIYSSIATRLSFKSINLYLLISPHYLPELNFIIYFPASHRNFLRLEFPDTKSTCNIFVDKNFPLINSDLYFSGNDIYFLSLNVFCFHLYCSCYCRF